MYRYGDILRAKRARAGLKRVALVTGAIVLLGSGAMGGAKAFGYFCSLPGLKVADISVRTAKADTFADSEIVDNKLRVVGSTIREVSAYNVGDPSQTDDTPCIAANGENICDALGKGYKRCAANFVPFGTTLHIDNYGDCLVTDRLASRFPNRVDIAMKLDEKARAINFGHQHLQIDILK